VGGIKFSFPDYFKCFYRIYFMKRNLLQKRHRDNIMDQVLDNKIFTDAKRKYHVDLKKMQEEMMQLGVINEELTMDQIERILKNPFIRYAYIFKDIEFSEHDHETYKESFASGQD